MADGRIALGGGGGSTEVFGELILLDIRRLAFKILKMLSLLT